MKKSKHDINRKEARIQKKDTYKEKYKLIFDMSPDGIIIVDPKTAKIIDFNRIAHTQLGYTREEFKELSLIDIEAQETPDEIKNHSKKVIKINRSEFETKHCKKGGEIRNVHVISQSIQIDGRKQIASIMKDITEEKKTEKHLQQRTHDLGERVKELNCLYTISEIQNLADMSIEEIIKEILDVIPTAWQYPEIVCARITLNGKEFTADNFQESRWFQTADIVVSGRITGSLEVYYIVETPEIDEGPFPKEERALIDNIGQIIGNFIDRKETQSNLQNNESMLQKSQEISRVGSFEMDLKTSDVRWSNQLYKLFGMKKSGNVVDYEKVLSLIHPDDRERAITISSDAVKEGKAYELEHRVIHPDGTILDLMVKGDVIYNEKNEPVKIVGTIQDITERNNIEKSLKESEERLRDFMESSTDSITIFNSELNYSDVNQVASDLARVPIKDMIGKNMVDVLPYLKDSERYYKYQEILKTSEPFHTEFKADNMFGNMYFSLRAFKVGTGLGIVITDVTKQKQSENSLRESEKRLRAFIDSAPSNFTLFDSKMNFIDINEISRKSFGLPKEEIIGKNIIDLNPELKGSDRHKRYFEVIKTGQNLFLDELELKDRFYSIRAFKAGSGMGMISTDITEKRRIEIALRERIKELTCLYSLSELTSNPEISIDEICHQIIEIIPPAWQYPEITCVRITLVGTTYTTDNFQKTPWKQSVDITISGKKIGSVEVHYLEERPFLKEERDLIDAIAREIEEFVISRRTNKTLEREIMINSAIADLSRSILSIASLEDISKKVLDYVRENTNSKFGYVGYIDKKGNLVSSTLTKDIWKNCKVEDKTTIFEKFFGLWGWVLDNKKPLLTNNPSKDPRSSGLPKGHISIKRFLSVPAMIGKRLVGQISLANSKEDYNDDDLELTKRFADIYAIAVRRYQNDKKIKSLNVSRDLVGQILRDIQISGNISDSATFLAGSELAKRIKGESLSDYLDSFEMMGLGTIKSEESVQKHSKWSFTSKKLVETMMISDRPTCNYTRGFLCGAVSILKNISQVNSVEINCQSMGDEECKFILETG